MKKKSLALTLVLIIILSLGSQYYADTNIIKSKISNAVYLGVVGYNTIDSDYKDSFQHRFSINGKEKNFKISNNNDYAINNLLAEGYIFDLYLDKDDIIVAVDNSKPTASGHIDNFNQNKIKVDGLNIKLTKNTQVYEITTNPGGAEVKEASLEIGRTTKVYGNPSDIIYLTFIAEPYEAPVKGVSGKRTIKNFLATSMEPVGTALYIYGGAWDWQDVGSSKEATSLGLSQTWLDFFQQNDKSFNYGYDDIPMKSYYPHSGYIQYYYAGIDCSGYVGWAMYNIMNNKSGGQGYVEPAGTMARTFAQTYEYGEFTQDFKNYDFKPGDVFSMTGHVWICLGVCDDGSIVILHSTPSDSYEGNPGGGVQISAIGESEECEAYSLAKKYMKQYYPEWSKRYSAVFKTYSSYTHMPNNYTGKFSWNINETGLLDPDGYSKMSAEEILEDLFCENIVLTGQDMVEKANKLGISPGKLNLIYKLMEVAEGSRKINIMDWKDSSIKDIQKEIKSYR